MDRRNRLAEAASPYLQQHAGNPVHWWEWGEEAFTSARKRDVPILLSVGYATCHWCHVMAHESFEDEATADLMNDWFVNVKVDREERPDVDRIYMDAVQAMTGRGGWPMTVFLTPGGEPFFAGTYFPREDRGGHPSFARVLASIHDAWSQKRDEVEEQARRLASSIAVPIPPADGVPGEEELAAAYLSIASSFDPIHGGFGGAPKFPQAPTLEFLLRAAGREWAPDAAAMLGTTLSKMADGGIHDQLAGGFARYSVDDHWLVPHFEKMLYDNALLARLYTRGHQLTGSARFEAVARSTLEYMLRDLGLPEGGFASGEDADSEGAEGTFYVFTHQEVVDAAGEAAAIAVQALGVTEAGNFEGRNVLHAARAPAELAEELGTDPAEVAASLDSARAALLEVRAARPRPQLDDKVVTAWNGLAIRALAEAGTVFSDAGYISAAERAGDFLLERLRDDGGRLRRSYRDGRLGPPAFCDDYGALALGLFALYRSTGDDRWFRAAAALSEEMVELFRDPGDGSFWATGSDADELIARPKNQFDNPSPSDNALAAEAMQHMAAYTGDPTWFERVDDVLRTGGRLMERYPGGAGQHLALAASSPIHEVALIGPDTAELRGVLDERFRPGVIVAWGAPEDSVHPVPLMRDRPMIDGLPTAYVCRGFVCDAPVTDPDSLRSSLP